MINTYKLQLYSSYLIRLLKLTLNLQTEFP